MEGEPAAAICQKYGIYEGNLMRSVLKLNSMLEEWRSMASFCEHAEVLEAFRNAHELILRESVIQDSLYLAI
jgi:superfamily II RNA helicase